MEATVENDWTAAELGRRAVGLTRGRAVAGRPPRPLGTWYAALYGLRKLVSAVNRYASLADQNWSGGTSPLAAQLRALLASCGPRTRSQITAALPLLLPLLARVGTAAAAEYDALRQLVLEEDGRAS